MSLRCKLGLHEFRKRTQPSGIFAIVCERCGEKHEYPAHPTWQLKAGERVTASGIKVTSGGNG